MDRADGIDPAFFHEDRAQIIHGADRMDLRGREYFLMTLLIRRIEVGKDRDIRHAQTFVGFHAFPDIDGGLSEIHGAGTDTEKHGITVFDGIRNVLFFYERHLCRGIPAHEEDAGSLLDQLRRIGRRSTLVDDIVLFERQTDFFEHSMHTVRIAVISLIFLRPGTDKHQTFSDRKLDL